MRRRELIEQLSLFYLLSLVGAVAVFAFFDDPLFFSSDFRSVLILCGSLAFVGTVLLALAAVVSALCGRRRLLREIVEAVIPALIVSLIALMALDFLQREFQIIGFVGGDEASVVIAVLCVLLLVAIGVRRWRRRERDDVARRVARLALVVSPVCAVVVSGWVAYGHFGPARRAPVPPRHVVLVVLDAWPATSYLHTYDPSMPPRPVDDVFRDALVFRNMHTNTVWTFGYFDAIYRGVARYDAKESAKLRRRTTRDENTGGWNLLTTLQGLDVKTRWVAYHRIGVPESHFVSAYDGFRSIHLSERHAGFLRALGIDYNVFIANPTIRRLLATPRRRLLYDALNTGDRYQDELHDVLLPEIRSLQRRANRSFLVYHGRWHAGPFMLPAAWEEEARATERDRLAAAVKARDNRYLASEAWYADELREQSRHYIDLVGEKIVRLVSDMEREGLMENTLLILTADHGSIFDRGRLWYIYHADEEVARVPLIMFGAGRKGTDDSLRESIDISRTIVEYFGGTSDVAPRAVSLLSTGEKPFTATITRRAEHSREWFLVLYTPEGKYRFNLDPEGAGESLLTQPTARGDSVIASGPEVIAHVEPFVREALVEYGLSGADLHPRYRALLPAGE